MADKKRMELEFYTKVKTDIDSVKGIVSTLQNKLDSLEMPKDISKGLEKTLNKVIKNIGEFEIAANRGVSSLADTKTLNSAWKQIIKDLDSIELGLKNIDASKIFPKEVLNNIKQADSALDKYLKKLENGKLSSEYKNKSQARDSSANKEVVLQSELTRAIQDKIKKESAYHALSDKWSNQTEAQYNDQKKALKEANDQLKKQKDHTEELIKQREELVKEGYITASKTVSKTKEQVASKIEDPAEKQAVLDKLEQARQVIAELKASKSAEKDYEGTVKGAKEAIRENEELKESIDSAKKAFEDASSKVESYDKQLTQTKQETSKLNSELEAMILDQAKAEWEALVKIVKEFTGIDLSESSQEVEAIQSALTKYKLDEIKKIPGIVEDMKSSFAEAEGAVRGVSEGLNETAESAKELNNAAQEVENLKNQVLQFFSITNSIQLFKRVVSDAINTVKELDAVMTETAVVTDFTVGDMWEKLPVYSKQATALGASIRDLYSATTLYYQQGLKTNAAMGVGIETMKMARIANMDATDATTAMTAALRGFNMEVNELNAQRVNDVYSELAAITAADTNQIATAMSKTASIASSANMEFETTAALLAQIIETTQEAPETAGTAMKTIIARFTEVKELFNEGMLTGKDDEGEEININKIDKALRSVGISLKDFLNGSKGMDDIFLELASKWGDLDLATQRYIATMAAGSRQQSRFIAMMSNYDRTMELVNAANNSTGASQEQFNKTLDSLEAKLQKLKNAWDEFAMGLANDEIIKLGVDLLTGILETVNNVTKAISGENGLIKSFVSLATVIGSLKGGSALFNNLFKGAKGQPSQNKTGFWKGLIGQDLKISPKMDDMARADFLKQVKDMNADVEGFNILKVVAKLDTEGYQEAVQMVEELGGKTEGLKEKFDLTGESSQTFAFNLSNLGAVAAGVGSAVSLLSNLAKEQGLDELATVLEAIGGTLVGIGSAAMVLGPVFDALKIKIVGTAGAFEIVGAAGAASGVAVTIGWGWVLGGFLAIAAAIGLVVAAFDAAKKASPEYKLEQTAKAAEHAAEAANEAAEAYDNLKTSLDSFDDKRAALDNLTAGTKEWKEAIVDINNEVLELIEKYPELAKFVKPQKNGALGFTSESIDGQTVDSVMNDYYQKTISTQAAKVAAQITQQQAQQDVYYSSLNDSAKITKTQTFSGPQYDQSGNYLGDFSYSLEIDNREETEKLAKEIAAGQWTNMADEDPERYYELEEFGQKLIASEQAIEVFTASLLDSAIINADVSEDFRQNAGRIYDAEYIDSLLTKAEGDIDPTDEETKKDYAARMGYQYENGKFFAGTGVDKKEVTVTEQDIKTQLAAIKVQNTLIEKTENLANVMSNMGEEYSTIFSNLTTSSDGMNLTMSDLAVLNGPGAKAYKDSLFGEVGELYDGDRAAFDRVVNEAVANANLIKANASNKMSRMGVDTTKIDALPISVDSLAKMSESLYSTFLTSGSGAKELGDQLFNILGTMAPDQAEIFTQALSMIDWTNLGDIEDFDEQLNQLGLTANLSESQLDHFKNVLAQTNNAFRHFDLEKVREEVKSTEELIDDIKDREENERVFTKEQRDLILKGNPNLANNFVITGMDEFTYVGNSMNDLISALNYNTEAQLKEYGEQVKTKAEISGKWLDENNKNAVKTVRTVLDSKDINDNNRDWIIGAMRGLGMDEERGYLGNYTDSELLAIMQQEYDKYYGLNGITAQANIDAANQWNAQEGQKLYSAGKRTDYALLQDAQSGNEYAQNQILAEAAGYTELSDELREYNSLLDENGELKVDVTEEDKNAVLQQVKFKTELAKVKKELKDYGEKTNDLIDGLKNLDKNSEDYKDVLADLATETNKYLDSDINGEFFEQGKNLELLKQALAGDADAWEQFVTNAMIAKAATEDMTTDYKIQMEEIAAITQAMDDLTFDINGTADVSQIVEEFLRAGGEAAKVAEYLEELGLTNIDIEADLNLGAMEQAVAAGKDITIPVGSIKATNVRLAKSNFNSFRSGRGKSSGGSGSKENPWENSFDKLYNLVHKIDEELHQRERIERRYEKLLEAIDTSANKIVDVSQEELAQLEKERMLQEQLASGRKKQIVEYQSENSDLNKYAGVTQNERGEDVLRIDWDAINTVTDADEGERIEDYVSQLEEWFEELDSAEEALWDIEDAVEEIKDRGKDEYFNLEEAIKDALVNSYQAEIDKLNEVNESINNTNAELLSAIQSSIDKQRQDRENQRTEEDLEEKQRRLAYLQQDTSGANAMEILRLQEEISRGQEDYTDSLIDQKISELQQQNDEAAKQREKQIDLLQNQLDHYIETGGIWEEVYQLMDAGLDEESGLIRGSHLEKILQDSANFRGMSELEKVEWLNDTNSMIAQGLAYLELGRQLEDIGVKAGEQIEFTNKDGQKLTGTVDENGNVVASDGKTYTNVYQGADGKYYARDNIEPVEEPKVENPPQSNTPPTKSEETEKPKPPKTPKYWEATYMGNLTVRGNSKEDAETKAVSAINTWGKQEKAKVKARWEKGEGGRDLGYLLSKQKEIDQQIQTYKNSIKITKKYKQGGLADFTGPAWLDGTKSRPEIVLDAQDSRNFIQLRDILSSLLNRSITNTSTENNGDITYDIDINVESIGNDYDVDQVANRVKSLINQDARYRNNNAVSLKR